MGFCYLDTVMFDGVLYIIKHIFTSSLYKESTAVTSKHCAWTGSVEHDQITISGFTAETTQHCLNKDKVA